MHNDLKNLENLELSGNFETPENVRELCQRSGNFVRGQGILRLLTHVGFCSKTWSDTFRSVLIYGKEQKSQKIFHNRSYGV